jgi:hypothetical protein
LRADDGLEVVAPCGLADLLEGVCRRNPRRDTVAEYRRRLVRKRVAERLPKVVVIDPWSRPVLALPGSVSHASCRHREVVVVAQAAQKGVQVGRVAVAAGLDRGLLVRADDVLARRQAPARMAARVQVQHAAGLAANSGSRGRSRSGAARA